MQNLVRLLRHPPSHVKTLMLRTSVGAALSLGTLALAHMMPADTLDRPVKTIAAADAPAFDFGPRKTAEAGKAADAAKGDAAKTDALKTADTKDATQTAALLPAAPLPAARPRALPAAAKAADTKPAETRLADASALPSGVERFDRCRSACDSRDPALTGAALAMSVVASGPAMPVPPPEAAPQGPFRGAMGVIGDGRRMLDGALGTTTATLVAVKDAMLGAITPEY